MSLIIGKPTHVELGGVDVSGFVKDAGFDLSPWQTRTLDADPSGSVMFDFTARRSFTFEMTWDQLHPHMRRYLRRLFAEAAFRKRRLSRMRSAYRAKRGRR